MYVEPEINGIWYALLYNDADLQTINTFAMTGGPYGQPVSSVFNGTNEQIVPLMPDGFTGSWSTSEGSTVLGELKATRLVLDSIDQRLLWLCKCAVVMIGTMFSYFAFSRIWFT